MIISKVLSDMYIISVIRLLAIRRILFSYIAVAMLAPLGMMLMISFAAGVTEAAKINYLVGAVVFSLSLSGINGIGQEIAHDRLLGTLKWFITSPIHPISYVGGLLIPYLVAGFFNSTVILFIGKFIWNAELTLHPLLLVIFALCILSLLGVGVLIGSYSKTPAQAYGLTNIVSFITVFLSPVYYPMDALPPLLRPIAHILPTTYAAEVLRNMLKGAFVNIFENALILAIVSIALITVGISKIRWREN